MQPLTSLATLLAESPCWARDATPPEAADDAPALDGETFDVVVIGAGITGLTAAFHAARRGLRAAVLEANEPGAGASGRNSGFVIPALGRVGPAEVQRAWGETRATRFNARLGSAANALFEFIRAERIDCDARQNGWLQPDLADSDDPVWEQRLHAQRAGAARARLVERDELQALTGTARYPCALCLTEGGQIDPLAFTRGLARAFGRIGGMLVNGCRLITPAVPQTHRLAALDTSHGRVFARRVIMATNAYGHGGANGLTAATLPFAMILAAYDLPSKGAEQVLRANQPFSDVGRDMSFFRRLPGNRLLTGLFPTGERFARDGLEAELQRRIGLTFDLTLAPPSDLWAGRVGLTPRGLPQLVQLAPTVFGWTGCNGRGIALSFLMGQWLAELAADAPVASIPIPLRPLKPVRAPQLGVWFARRLIAAERRRRARHDRLAATLIHDAAIFPID
ncbi:NAD(P)/FAD-dependent oxidoreductase [Burkholderia cepacia]|uniref:NAD(P)/FAD-dependent oxidoreductase n=1 Tax=Burkholderia cepacia TaxID=292 RepID=UPI003D672EB6